MRRLCLHKNGLQAHTTGKPSGLAKNVRMLAYVPQDATVLSRWDGFSRVGALEVQPHQLQYSTYYNKNPAHSCVCPARRDRTFEGVPIYGGGGRSYKQKLRMSRRTRRKKRLRVVFFLRI